MSFKERINKVFGIHRPSEALMGVDIARDIKPIVLSKDFIIPPLPASIDELHEEKGTKENHIIEEWIWVEGYKGTYSDMTCQGYQYELNKQFDIEPGTKVKECENGFHLCLDLNDVFSFYKIGYGNRFFKVKALVRKSEYDSYGKYVESNGMFGGCHKRNKLAAMSIIFTEEVPMDELCVAAREQFKIEAKNIPDKYIKLAFETNIQEASDTYCRDTLIQDGYSETFVTYFISYMPRRFELAHALASVEGLSMDVKVMCIMVNSSDAASAKRSCR